MFAVFNVFCLSQEYFTNTAVPNIKVGTNSNYSWWPEQIILNNSGCSVLYVNLNALDQLCPQVSTLYMFLVL